MQDDYDLTHSSAPQNPVQPPPQHAPAAPNPYPFIEPRLGDAGGGGFPARRVAIIAMVLLLLLTGAGGVAALIGASQKKSDFASKDDSLSDKKTDTYSGDGSDISKMKSATFDWHCPDGSEKVSGEGSDMQCESTTTLTAALVKKILCPANTTKVTAEGETKCQKVLAGPTKKVAATMGYTCPSGYVRSGSGSTTKCTRTVKLAPTTTYSCPSGYARSGSGSATTCTRSVTTAGSLVVTCPTGYKLSSGTCVRTIAATATKTYSCPSGYTKVSINGVWKCRRRISVPSNGVCPSGYTKVTVNGVRKCQRIISATVTTTYSCPSGYTRSGTTCTAKTAPKYSCPAGYASTGSGATMTCHKVTVTRVAPTKTATCSSGYHLSSGSCVKTTTMNGVRVYSCPSGYGLSGTTCFQATSSSSYVAPDTQTSCPPDYTQSKDGTQCEKQQVQKIQAVQEYYCDDGWELLDVESSGEQCVQKND